VPRTPDHAAASIDAIVVLGCRVDPHRGLSDSALRRVTGAREAFFEGIAPIVVASGGRRWGDRVEAVAIAEELLAAGVSGEAVYTELASLTTTENAAYTAALVRRLVGRRPRVAIVTCSWHMPRALRCFERAGADVVARPVDPPSPTPAQALARRVHEIVSSRLDRLAYERGGVDLARYAPSHLAASHVAAPHQDPRDEREGRTCDAR
jgi:uncharacterized SAM-binding protein YcdF (DUF218 family)